MTEDERIAELEREVERLLKEKALDNCFWKQECDSLQKTVAENYKLQNQKAVECLKDVLDHFTDRPTFYDYARQELCISDKDRKFVDYVYSKIKELEGEKQ